ncbi:MAG: hypothetical protein V5B60_17525 [Accumulibacter sp.]|jgi:hypothetical protein
MKVLVDYLTAGDSDFSEARRLISQVKIVSAREFALAAGLDLS